MGEGTQQTLRRTAQASGKDVSLWYRRDVFSAAGWAGLFVAIMVAVMGFMRYMFPRVLFEPPTTFKAGSPEEYALGAVNEKFKKDQRVWIVRQEDGSFFCDISDLHSSGLYAELVCHRQQIQVSLSWQRLLSRWHQLRRSGTAAPRSPQSQSESRRSSGGRQRCRVSHGPWRCSR